jgi:uncharacterized membrane protein YhdT
MVTFGMALALLMLAAWVIISYLPSPRPSILARPLPMLRLTLRAWALLIVVLAVDFAINVAVVGYDPPQFVWLAALDGVTIGLSVLTMMVSQPTPRDLWALALAVACAGQFCMPSYSVR